MPCRSYINESKINYVDLLGTPSILRHKNTLKWKVLKEISNNTYARLHFNVNK